MTPQELINKVYSHLIKQGGPSQNNGSCAYRAPDGRQCAIGCLIPDELYSPEMEHNSLGVLLEISNFHLPKFMQENQNLLQALQNIHDLYDAPNYGDWNIYIITRFRVVVDVLGLSLAKL